MIIFKKFDVSPKCKSAKANVPILRELIRLYPGLSHESLFYSLSDILFEGFVTQLANQLNMDVLVMRLNLYCLRAETNKCTKTEIDVETEVKQNTTFEIDRGLEIFKHILFLLLFNSKS